jgi:hypothetical protein
MLLPQRPTGLRNRIWETCKSNGVGTLTPRGPRMAEFLPNRVDFVHSPEICLVTAESLVY